MTSDKTAWGPGPWHDEPDRVLGHHRGFPVLVRRGPQGAWCGYVGVDPDHPWYGRDYDAVQASVHGGLTYAAPCDDDPVHGVCHDGPLPTVWWVGFDCGHVFDLIPGFEFTVRAALEEQDPTVGWDIDLRTTYKDLAYVWDEAIDLAEQAADAARAHS